MKNDVFVAGILVVAVGAPAAGLQIDLHIAGNRWFIFKLEDGAAKIRSAFGAGKTGMEDAEIPAIGRLQLIAPNPLVLPDGLQQFFRRHGTGVAEEVYGAAALAPDGVKIFRAGVHIRFFPATGTIVKMT